jgi:hypothetical protein
LTPQEMLFCAVWIEAGHPSALICSACEPDAERFIFLLDIKLLENAIFYVRKPVFTVFAH